MQRRHFFLSVLIGTALSGLARAWPGALSVDSPQDASGGVWPVVVPLRSHSHGGVLLVGSLGDDSGDQLAPIAAEWVARGMTVDLVVVKPGDRAGPAEWDRAISQLHTAVAAGANALACIEEGEAGLLMERVALKVGNASCATRR